MKKETYTYEDLYHIKEKLNDIYHIKIEFNPLLISKDEKDFTIYSINGEYDSIWLRYFKNDVEMVRMMEYTYFLELLNNGSVKIVENAMPKNNKIKVW